MSSWRNEAATWQTLYLEDAVARVRVPRHRDVFPCVVVMLHGWTGDEGFMAPFAGVVPEDALVVAFRAPWAAHSPRGGYSWVDYRPGEQSPAFARYREAAGQLRGWVASLRQRFPRAQWACQHWMGFSQGAAMVGVYGLEYPDEVASLALLAGFLPHGAEARAERQPLAGRRAFVAHGVQDSIVPIARGRAAAEVLRRAGARVMFCEDDVAHKVGARCRKALEGFYTELAGRCAASGR